MYTSCTCGDQRTTAGVDALPPYGSQVSSVARGGSHLYPPSHFQPAYWDASTSWAVYSTFSALGFNCASMCMCSIFPAQFVEEPLLSSVPFSPFYQKLGGYSYVDLCLGPLVYSTRFVGEGGGGTGEERAYFPQFHITVHPQRNLRQEPGGRSWNRSHEGVLFALHGYSDCFFIEPSFVIDGLYCIECIHIIPRTSCDFCPTPCILTN